ncbi:hypothetical protein [Lewinella sp. W8]|uniref:hypothetical protein n=1 Tax=Lewinella sp. W8 TaxID=2528208 RepID=UPI0012B54850|nr:hypothetical protein [Lewinella sp. W8]MTB52835.1 hypothetical protein [Lewinella sp. W8]
MIAPQTPREVLVPLSAHTFFLTSREATLVFKVPSEEGVDLVVKTGQMDFTGKKVE